MIKVFRFLLFLNGVEFLESAMNKWEMKSNAKLRSNNFSVKVSVLAVVFRRQISKNRQFWLKLSVF